MVLDARPPAWPILVAGAGPPGLATALALRRALGPAIAITVADPVLNRTRPDGRAYAVSAGSRAFLSWLGLWDGLAERAQPIRGMLITDSRLLDAVRPAYLSFDETAEPLGHMLGAEDLGAALRGACLGAGIVLEPAAVELGAPGPGGLPVRVGGDARTVSLLVAADGARSRLRDAAGIGWTGRRYRQAGLVGTVGHSRDHRGRATQHFLPAGPFAILPLRPGPDGPRSSVVWTEREEVARALLQGPSAELHRALEERFGPELGEIRLETPLSAHPLSTGLARSFAAGRLALVGDAAHEVHPLAGQGLNLGLADVAALVERVAGAVRLGLDPGGPDVLAGFERDRRFDAVALATATEGLNALFSNRSLPLRVLRDIGLGLVDRSPGLKGRFASEASGTVGRAPRLMRGESI